MNKEKKALRKLAAAVKFVQENYPLPRCPHGNALQDHAGDTLEPSCGCRTPQVTACAQSAFMVERYLLGELEGAEKMIFEEHMAKCNICAESVRNGKRFINVIKDGA